MEEMKFYNGIEKAELYDYTEKLISFEMGDLSTIETLKLFAYLIKTGDAWRLDLVYNLGSYGRTAKALIDNKIITPDGKII